MGLGGITADHNNCPLHILGIFCADVYFLLVIPCHYKGLLHHIAQSIVSITPHLFFSLNIPVLTLL